MTEKTFHKILIANRGEIAARIIKAIKKENKLALVIYSDIDKNLPFVEVADEKWPLGTGSLLDTYLNQQKIIDIALKSGADAIHPGYGFLSENSDFAELCRKNNIDFIGPSPEVIKLMGNKSNARESAKKYGVPIIEGVKGNIKEILKSADSLKFPLLIKPSAGGGGKGMRIVNEQSDLKEALSDSTREAINYFGSDELYIEKYVTKARHIEVQVIADQHGNAVHLFERECTMQRRYQKIIEEAPAASISDKLRRQITNSALKLTQGIKYTNAGTIEFLVDEEENYFFIEMNTRIQVEHPVSEMLTGIDIVREQIKIAEGQALSVKQDEIKMVGHSIEARIYAEDPQKEFMPASGIVRKLDDTKLNCRIDGGYMESDVVSSFYDPMIAKIIVSGRDRDDAIQQLISNLKNYHLSGFSTNKEFLISLLRSSDFIKNKIYTKYIDANQARLLDEFSAEKDNVDSNELLSIAALAFIHHKYSAKQNSIWDEIGYWRQQASIQIQYNSQSYRIPFVVSSEKQQFNFFINEESLRGCILEKKGNFYNLLISGKQFSVWIDINLSDITIDFEGYTFSLRRLDIPDYRYIGKSSKENTTDSREIIAPLNGKIVKVNVKRNDTVKTGDTLMVIESMKMENKITSHMDAVIENINVKDGELVELNKLLITLNRI